MIDPSRITRWRSTATTWVRKAVAIMLNADPRNDEEKWLVGYDAALFMEAALSELHMLVKLLPADMIEDVDRHAKALSTAIRAHRLSGKLENVTGRTPEEAQSFLDKAARLRDDAGT